MKLSDIITLVNQPTDDTHKYLLFRDCSGYCKPYIAICNLSRCLCGDDSFYYEVKNIDEVNIKYLYYYIRLHMKLLSGESHILSADFINNIELPPLPKKEVQNAFLPCIRSLHELGLESFNDKIIKLFHEIYVPFDSIIDGNSDGIKISKLFKITNKELFYKNIKEGKFQDPIKNYIKILEPELLDSEFLVHFLYYTTLCDLDHINVPVISDQKSVVKIIKSNHNKTIELKIERKNNKLALRKLIDVIGTMTF